MKVGFLGLGNMGSAVARNLIKAGHALTVYMALGMKDNCLVLAAAEDAAVPLPLASLIRDRMLAATAQGMGEADSAAIARISFTEAGL